MENMNIAQNAAALPVITDKTTLGELLAMLALGEKPPVPTPRELFETLGTPIADMNDCILFSNGFAIYQNCTGRTVVWLPYCTSFTYYFNKLRDAEKDTLSENYELPEGFLETQPWVIAVTLIGDHRIERNSMNHTGSRKDTVDLASKDKGDKDGEMEEIIADPFRRAFNWYDGHMGENPQDAVERRETREEMLAAMTDKQREVFIMYYRDGMTQDQIRVSVVRRTPTRFPRISRTSTGAQPFTPCVLLRCASRLRRKFCSAIIQAARTSARCGWYARQRRSFRLRRLQDTFTKKSAAAKQFPFRSAGSVRSATSSPCCTTAAVYLLTNIISHGKR